MDARRGERARVCGGGHRRGWHGPAEPVEADGTSGRGRCDRAESGGTHGAGYDGVPKGGGRGHCHGGGHIAAPDGVNQGDAPARRPVEDLRRNVETTKHPLESQSPGREFLPEPDVP